MLSELWSDLRYRARALARRGARRVKNSWLAAAALEGRAPGMGWGCSHREGV